MATATESAQSKTEALYQARLARYVTAMRNGKPDRVPIRPFVAEFTGKYAGYTCQQLAHDYEQAFAAARQTAAAFDWDAIVPNMVYVWTGLAQALGLKYYAIPGIDVPAETGFQYREPPEHDAYMKPDEYDALIADPNGYLLNVWLPRVAAPLVGPGQPNTPGNQLALVKGAMAMSRYFGAFGAQIARMRTECGVPSAIAGIFKAPMDILADKLRGYLGLVEDLYERRDKVVAACEALMPHLYWVAKATADPARLLPIGYWMHRGGVPFVSFEVFENIYWATVKPIVEELWRHGHQTLFYAEGKWDHHLEAFATLPERSIVYHVDQGDVAKTHRVLGEKFCLSGGIANTLLARAKPEQVRQRVKEVIETAGRDGGYILDASAIVQNDADVTNMRAFTDAGREFGVYSDGHSEPPPVWQGGAAAAEPAFARNAAHRAGVCQPWDDKRQTLKINGDEGLCRQVWEDIDGMAAMFVWQVLLSF